MVKSMNVKILMVILSIISLNFLISITQGYVRVRVSDSDSDNNYTKILNIFFLFLILKFELLR